MKLSRKSRDDNGMILEVRVPGAARPVRPVQSLRPAPEGEGSRRRPGVVGQPALVVLTSSKVTCEANSSQNLEIPPPILRSGRGEDLIGQDYELSGAVAPFIPAQIFSPPRLRRIALFCMVHLVEARSWPSSMLGRTFPSTIRALPIPVPKVSTEPFRSPLGRPYRTSARPAASASLSKLISRPMVVSSSSSVYADPRLSMLLAVVTHLAHDRGEAETDAPPGASSWSTSSLTAAATAGGVDGSGVSTRRRSLTNSPASTSTTPAFHRTHLHRRRSWLSRRGD